MGGYSAGMMIRVLMSFLVLAAGLLSGLPCLCVSDSVGTSAAHHNTPSADCCVHCRGKSDERNRSEHPTHPAPRHCCCQEDAIAAPTPEVFAARAAVPEPFAARLLEVTWLILPASRDTRPTYPDPPPTAGVELLHRIQVLNC